MTAAFQGSKKGDGSSSSNTIPSMPTKGVDQDCASKLLPDLTLILITDEGFSCQHFRISPSVAQKGIITCLNSSFYGKRIFHHVSLVEPCWLPQPLMLPAEVYKVGVTHYFSYLRAKEELGYTPITTPQEGMATKTERLGWAHNLRMAFLRIWSI